MDNILYKVVTILATDSEVNLFLVACYKPFHNSLLLQTTLIQPNINLTTGSTADLCLSAQLQNLLANTPLLNKYIARLIYEFDCL